MPPATCFSLCRYAALALAFAVARPVLCGVDGRTASSLPLIDVSICQLLQAWRIRLTAEIRGKAAMCYSMKLRKATRHSFRWRTDA